MNHETEIRTKLAKMYSLLSVGVPTPEQMEAADRKLSEAIGILTGMIPVQAEEEKTRG
jgi:hypothetical protein